MEKAMWTWRETTESAKLTFGFNFIVLFTVFQLFMLHDKKVHTINTGVQIYYP